jgi:hypothetical protein
MVREAPTRRPERPPRAPRPASHPAASVLVAFDHENRLRVLEGQPPLELFEFLRQTRLGV